MLCKPGTIHFQSLAQQGGDTRPQEKPFSSPPSLPLPAPRMSQKQKRKIEDLASLSPYTLREALKASEEREAEQRRGGRSKKRKIAEKQALEAKLKQVKEELREDTTSDDDGDDGSEYDESEEERPIRRTRKPAPHASVASTSAGSKSKKQKVMSKRYAGPKP